MDSPISLDQLNHWPSDKACEFFLGACHCVEWARTMAAARPFSSFDNLAQQAQHHWAQASEAQRLEAFAAHPKIGDMQVLRDKFASKAHEEQGQVSTADEATIRELHALNIEYENTFGFIFIVCASGKSAEEMLLLLRQRLPNSRAQELDNGAREQGKITQLRLRKAVQ